MLVPDLIGSASARVPERVAVGAEDRELTFADVDARANALVAYFDTLGLQPGDRVALFAKNEAEYLEIQVAAIRAGLILVPLNFRLAIPELDYIVRDCQPRVLICGDDYVRPAGELPVPHRLALGPAYEEALAGSAGATPAPVDAARAATILYTSGTTGRPKGAVLSNQALYARIATNLFEYQVRDDDRFLQCLPMFHIASNVTYTYAHAGASNVLVRDFDVATVLELIAQHRITTALLVPTMINALVNSPLVADADLSSLTTIAYGASPIPPVVLAQAIEVLGCNFLQLFGMTETSAATVLRPPDHDPAGAPERLASAGTVALGMEMRVVDATDADVSTGEVGEVICRGPAVMDQYWNAPEATAEALRDGWMHTGDLGYQDAEGYLYVTDRKKDMIVSGGENVYPREVEDVLFEHPDVLEAAVIGVPDERWGERVHALVVPRGDGRVAIEDLLGFARERLAGYKVPKSAEIVGELPKNATGKVLKTTLREPFWRDHERGVS